MPNGIKNRREQHYVKQKGRCHYCGFTMGRHLKHSKEILKKSGVNTSTHIFNKMAAKRIATFEHVKLKSQGGGKRDGVAACDYCNTFRRDHGYEIVKKIIAYMIKKEIHPHQIFHRTGMYMVHDPVIHKSIIQKEFQNGKDNS